MGNSPSAEYSEFLGTCCPNLRTLYLNEVQLTDQALESIAKDMPNLRVLYADGNKISDQGV